MAAKMAAILDFTKNSNLAGKFENCKYFLLELYSVIELNILLLLVAFSGYVFSLNNGENTHFYSNMT